MKYNDYELLDLIDDNDEVAYNIMINKYKPVIYNKALEYYTYLRNNNYEGLTLDDFLEEGLITLNHAIKSFDSNKGSLFYSFLLVCLTSSFNLMLRKIFTIKNRPLLKYQELEYEVKDSKGIDPYDYVDNLDIYNELNDYLYSVSLIDSAIIELRLNDFKYSEIMELLDVSSSKINRTIKMMRERLSYISPTVKKSKNN